MQENKQLQTAPQPQAAQQPNEMGLEIDIFQFLETWRKHISVIILLAVIGGLIGYTYTLMLVSPRYQASATMYVVSASANSVVDISDLSLGTNLTADYIQLVTSRTMLERVIEDTGDPLTTQQLLNMVSVSNNSGTRILTFSVTSVSPQQAMRLANSFVKQAIIYLPEIMGIKDNPPKEIDLATLPSSPYNMNYLRNMLIGMLGGAVLAMGIYALIEILTDTFNNAEDVEKVIGVAPVAIVPENNTTGKGGYGYGKYYSKYYYYYSNANAKADSNGDKRRSK